MGIQVISIPWLHQCCRIIFVFVNMCADFSKVLDHRLCIFKNITDIVRLPFRDWAAY